jgi:aromatic-L-amino-acid decarboxylase
MDTTQFRELGYRMVDEVATYWDRLQRDPGSVPVLSRSKPGDTAALLPTRAPEHAESWEAMFADIERVIMPGLTHWQHPNFYAFFPANISGPAVLGELLSAGLGVQGMLWATSPACTELETRVLDWLARAVGLPDDFLSTSPTGGGVIQGTASEAVLAALVAARHRAVKKLGPACVHNLCVYTSSQAHSSVIKAAMIAGFALEPDDRARVRTIDVDATFRMRPDLLEAAMRADIAAGLTPCFVCASVGTTGCTAIDDITATAHAIARASTTHRPWLHVDAAHAGAACICPEYQPWLAGIEHADSFCFNPHKWLLTNFDCDCFWTRDRASLTASMSITPEYLRNPASESGAVFDYRDWHVPLGRRFRSLKLWFVIRHYGLEGLRTYIREHMRLASLFESWVQADARFELSAPRTMNLVCFRLHPHANETSPQTDARNKRMLDAINATGLAYLTHTALPTFNHAGAATSSQLVIRMAIGATTTQESHVHAAWQLISRIAVDHK